MFILLSLIQHTTNEEFDKACLKPIIKCSIIFDQISFLVAKKINARALQSLYFMFMMSRNDLYQT